MYCKLNSRIKIVNDIHGSNTWNKCHNVAFLPLKNLHLVLVMRRRETFARNTTRTRHNRIWVAMRRRETIIRNTIDDGNWEIYGSIGAIMIVMCWCHLWFNTYLYRFEPLCDTYQSTTHFARPLIDMFPMQNQSIHYNCPTPTPITYNVWFDVEKQHTSLIEITLHIVVVSAPDSKTNIVIHRFQQSYELLWDPPDHIWWNVHNKHTIDSILSFNQ